MQRDRSGVRRFCSHALAPSPTHVRDKEATRDKVGRS